jgi:hypothetical protein
MANIKTKSVISDQVLVQGDLSSLDDNQRAAYYLRVCESLGLNPHTQPFEYLKLNGQIKLYATKACSDQLRKINGVSLEIISKELVDEVYTVTARAEDAAGRRDESCGVVSLKGMQGEPRANAIMKAETKAKRRVTLSICGLGWLDETEVESIQASCKQPATQTMNLIKQKDPAGFIDHVEEFNAEQMNTEALERSALKNLLLDVEELSPGTQRRMLEHYKTIDVEGLTMEQVQSASEKLTRKLKGLTS